MASAADTAAALLASSLSPDPSQRLPAEQALTSLIRDPESFPALLNVLANQQERQPIRLAAALALKNTVEKYWRRAAVGALGDPTKQLVRSGLLELLPEPSTPIARTLALTTAKIARFDYDEFWPDIFIILSQPLNDATTNNPSSYPENLTLILNRSLLYIHQAVKHIASNRLPSRRLLIYKLSRSLLPRLLDFYASTLNSLDPSVPPNTFLARLEMSLLAFKSISYLAAYGTTYDTDSVSLQRLVSIFLESIPALLDIRKRYLHIYHQGSSSSTTGGNPNPPLQKNNTPLVFQRLLIQYPKLASRILAHDRDLFVQMKWAHPLIDTFWKIIDASSQPTSSLVSDNPMAPFPQSFIIQVMHVCRLLTTGPINSSQEIASPKIAAQIASTLVTRVMPLSPSDLEEWSDDPEEWLHQQESENREQFELRSCAEQFLRDLFTAFPDAVSHAVVNCLDELTRTNPVNVNSIDVLVQKEAIYAAFGIGAPSLISNISFEIWLNNTLLPELVNENPDLRLIRRTVVWLLGQFVAQEPQLDLRIRVYEIFFHMLKPTGPSTDLAIRLTAADALTKCDTWDFPESVHINIVSSNSSTNNDVGVSAVDSLCQLLADVKMVESQIKVNKAFETLIDRTGSFIFHHAHKILDVLFSLWENVSHHPRFKPNVLATAYRLVFVLGDNSNAINDNIAPLIAKSVDPINDDSTTQEEGLILWQKCIEHSNLLTPIFASLMPMLVSILEQGSDNLPHAISVLYGYLLLDANRFVNECGYKFCEALQLLLGDLRVEATKILLSPVNILVQLAPVDSWAPAMDSSGLFAKLIFNLTSDETSSLITTKYIATLSRILISNPAGFCELVTRAASQLNSDPETIYSVYTEQCISKFDNIATSRDRKLIAMALSALVGLEVTPVLQRMAEVLSVWVSALAQTEETFDGDAQLYQVEEAASDGEYEDDSTAQGRRKIRVANRDPARSVRLTTYISKNLKMCEEKLQQQQNGSTSNGGVTVGNGGGGGTLQLFRQTYMAGIDQFEVEELENRLSGRMKG